MAWLNSLWPSDVIQCMSTEVWVNIGSVNCLLSGGIKQLPHLILSYHHQRCSVTFMTLLPILKVLLRPESTLAQVISSCLTVPIHSLDQCQLIVKSVQWHLDYLFVHSKNYSTPIRGQWVNIIRFYARQGYWQRQNSPDCEPIKGTAYYAPTTDLQVWSIYEKWSNLWLPTLIFYWHFNI